MVGKRMGGEGKEGVRWEMKGSMNKGRRFGARVMGEAEEINWIH